MKTFIAVLLGASPLVLHMAIAWSIRPLVIVFLVMITTGVLAGLVRGRFSPWVIPLAALGVGACALADLGAAERVASAWPVLVYVAIAWVFGTTLRPGAVPLIERIARFVDYGDAMPAEIAAYTRFLTWAWTVIPLSMAVASVLLAEFASRETWSLFTNVLSYLALALLFFAEYPYRRWRYPDTPHTNPVAVAVRLARHAPELFRPQSRHSG